MYLLLESWKMPDWKFPHRDILTECRKWLRSTMYSMERIGTPNPSLENSSKHLQQVVAVEAVETLLNVTGQN